MPSDNILASWIQEVRDELRDASNERHELDKRIVRLETRNKLAWALVGFITTVGSIVIAILALKK